MVITEQMKVKYLTQSYGNALASPDPSTQNGSVLVNPWGQVIGNGCNTFPYYVLLTEERLNVRDTKYKFIEHAERNAIYEAAYFGNATNDAVLFCQWFACADCARAIIQAGIARVIGHKQIFEATPERWKDSIASAFEMFKEAGVETELFDYKFNLEPIRLNGQLWTP